MTCVSGGEVILGGEPDPSSAGGHPAHCGLKRRMYRGTERTDPFGKLRAGSCGSLAGLSHAPGSAYRKSIPKRTDVIRVDRYHADGGVPTIVRDCHRCTVDIAHIRQRYG